MQERLLIQVDEKGARVVEGRLDKLGKTAGRSQKGVSLLRRGLAGLATTATIGAVLKLGDSFTELQNKLRVVTSGTGNLNRVTNDLLTISRQTRSSVENNAALFSRLSLATKDLGTSQKEVLDFTKSLNQATIISGASAEEARNAIIQLSQGLASGALRGDELRSVLEQLPVVADVIATELGVTRGELRELGKQGAITADVVLKAFRNARGELEGKFGKTIPTLAQAFTVLRSQVTVTFGRLLQGSGILSSLANTILSVTNGIAALEVKILQLDRALTGTLTQSDELSTTMKVLASAGVAAGFVIRNLAVILIEGLGVAVKAALTPLKALSASFDELSKGNFLAAAKAIPNTFRDNFGQISGIVKNVGRNIVAETLDAADKFNAIWDESAREAGASVQQVLASGSLDTPNLSGGGGGNTAELQKAISAQREYIEGLRIQAQQQALTAIEGVKGENALRLYNTALEAGALGGDAFVAQALEIARGMNEQALAVERLNDQREDGNVIASLQEEQRLLKLSNVERAIEINLRKLSKNATEEQKNQVRQLTFALETEREKLKETKKDFEKFLKDFKASATNILAGALADPLGDGFKDLPKKFADLLVQMTSQLLASQFIKLLTSSFGGGGGGTGGLISSLIGAFAGGFATGGQFTVPGSGGQDSQLVGLRATPGETVTVTRPGQSIAEAAAGSIGNAQGGQPTVELSVINVTDPSEAAAAISSADGERAILNVISKNKEAIKQELT